VKKHPTLPDAATILKEMISPNHALPKRISGPPETHEERVEAYEHLVELAENPDNIRIVCIGCSLDVPLLESSPCACGGFVCAHCQRIEEDGVCDHTPMVGMEDDDDD